MIIGGLQKTSLIDYPNKIAAIVFTQGCNFKCGYCHNPELIEVKESGYKIKEVLDFLESRIGKLDGVVITGGEPTLQKGLKEFVQEIKFMKFSVKLDTNGTNPTLLEELINERLVDYIAMDIKSPLKRYEEITNSKVTAENISKSINIISSSAIDYEYRTTVVSDFFTIDDFEEIGKLISGAKRYYLQNFVSSKLLDPTFIDKTAPSEDQMSSIKTLLSKYIQEVYIR